MPAFIVQDQKIYAGGYDVTGSISAVALTGSRDLKDATVLGNAGRVRKGGLFSATLQVEGFWASDTVDPLQAAHFGLANVPISVIMGPSAGAPGYMFQSLEGEYEFGGQIGEMCAYSAGAQSSNGLGLIRAMLLHNTPVSGNGTGTPTLVGPVGGTQILYAALHVTALTGLLDVRISSDDLVGFATPTIRITFPQATTAGTSHWLTLAGPITDTFWRIDWTLTGTATFAVVIGIQ